jgi:hypothetical protein
VLFLDQIVDVDIIVGSRYAQSILEMLVHNRSSRLGFHMLHSGENCSHKYVLYVGFYMKYQMHSVPCESGKHLTILNTAVYSLVARGLH